MNSDGFEGLAISLSDKFQTILYDQRGTGKSVMDKLDASTITLDLMLADMESLRYTLGITRWSILGHSFGGMLASAYAARYPEQVDKLILSSSGGIDLSLLDYFRESLHSKLTGDQLDSVANWERQIAAGDTSHHARFQRGMHLAPAYVRDPKYVPVIAERLTQGNSTINQLMWANLRKINFNCAGSLRTFDRPVLIIQGKDDIIRPSTVEASHQAFRHSKVVYMEHCGHYGWLDNPEVYFREINDFLRG
jgi:proline iminopeptidase